MLLDSLSQPLARLDNIQRFPMSILTKIWIRLLRQNHREDFISKLATKGNTRILDVGCGNNSVMKIKKYCQSNWKNIFYSGLDIGDYNITEESKNESDEYVLTSPENFADILLQWENTEDIVISSHNLEHCNEPTQVLINMLKTVREGGYLYLSFPSEESIGFPKGFVGCLNFRDDLTHKEVVNWNDVLSTLSENGMEIIYSCKNYRPFLPRLIGRLTWFYVRRTKKVLPGTWEYFGFESIIWARKNID